MLVSTTVNPSVIKPFRAIKHPTTFTGRYKKCYYYKYKIERKLKGENARGANSIWVSLLPLSVATMHESLVALRHGSHTGRL